MVRKGRDLARRQTPIRRFCGQAGAFLLTATVVGLVWLAPAGTVHAQTARCLQLVNELAAIDSGGGFGSVSPRYRQYERAVRQQEAQIAKTERAARQNGCSGFGVFTRNPALCQRIRSSLNQMYANLQQLQRTKDRLAPRGNNRAARNAIIAELQRNRCQLRDAAPNRPQFASQQQPRRRTLLEQIFGVRTFREDGRGIGTAIDPDSGLASRYGTFRTLCVRSCDGYYFPISFSTVPDRFGDDEATCQSMCPGSQVELFYHQMPSQDSEDMISYRDGTPYRETETAFNYREKFDPQCGCRSPQGNLREVAGSAIFSTVAPQEAAQTSGPTIGTPVFKPDPGLDPDTLANDAEMLTLADIASLARKSGSDTPVARRNDGQRTVRIVGPSFFPAQ